MIATSSFSIIDKNIQQAVSISFIIYLFKMRIEKIKLRMRKIFFKWKIICNDHNINLLYNNLNIATNFIKEKYNEEDKLRKYLFINKNKLD